MKSKQFRVNNDSAVWKGAVAGLVAGLIGSWVKSKVEPPMQKVGEKLFPPTPAQKNLRGADTTGHPLNMPPAILVKEVAEKISGHQPDDEATEAAMMEIHYMFGTALGIGYGIVAEELPDVTVGAGVPIGAAMWAGTHGSVVPALGLQEPPDEMPAAWYVWEFGSHLVYGLTVELVRRAVRSRL